MDPLHSVKYLQCVYLSNNLHWNKHIKTISNKANKTLGFLKRNSIHCPPRTKETAYKALVRPTLEYCSSVWDPHTDKNTNTVEIDQRRAAHWVLNHFDRKDSVTEMLSTLKLKTLESWRIIACLSILYKMPGGGGGYSHKFPIRVCAAQRGRHFKAPDLEWGIHFRGVF